MNVLERITVNIYGRHSSFQNLCRNLRRFRKLYLTDISCYIANHQTGRFFIVEYPIVLEHWIFDFQFYGITVLIKSTPYTMQIHLRQKDYREFG